MKKISLGFSSCPNDTFIFDAMVHHKIDTEGLEFDIIMADVEELNKRALNQELDVTKISYHAFAYISDNYCLLDSGSALGKNNGPLLISKRKIYPDEINDLKIAIPGKHTTANLLFSVAYPRATNKTEYVFSKIEDVVLSDEVDAGLIIHENRFTYEKKGLRKIIDLGEYWENETHLPIPLGGIAVKRNLDSNIQLKINRILKSSVEFAFKNPKTGYLYIKKNAQELDEEVIYKHINLYVNNFSLDLGKEGREAIQVLYKKAISLGIIHEINKQIFLT
ncbi:MAG: 1,4-dihydroxy-6-naphthoate synthase [Bacteroidetes bacterium GWF2_33_16]|nr:MAG: 1,4-dihydroxy-6-naphthoate synthase [Bacteroidetes bacterium GWE2_32_14]OFY08944.1 MAG: 1,4-dihydroxy-6-naphthoate synthase [Bacteroidetes bacterium GWF2_33_16]